MSQQKMLLAVCVAAGLIALAAGQGFDQSKCSQGVQQTMTDYQKTVSQQGQKFISQLTSTAGSAVDINGLNKAVQNLVNQYTQMGDFSNGIDLQNLAGQAAGLMQSNAALVPYFANFRLGPQFFTMYMSFVSTMTTEFGKMVTSVSNQCLPGGH